MTDYHDLVREMKYVKALLAMNFVKDFETKSEKILFLNGFGFETNEIAQLIGTTPGTVAVTISQAKVKKKQARNPSKTGQT